MVSEVAQKVTEEIIKNASKIYETIRGSYTVFPPEMVVYCPENIQKYSIAFEARGGIVPKKIPFPYGTPKRIKLRSLRGLEDLSSAITVTPDGFNLNTKCMSDIDTYILDLEYEIRNPNYLDALIDKHRAKEVPSEDRNEYWLHAELKHPSVLKTKYGKLELEDIDFSIDVGISSDINTVIPPSFRNELEIGVRLLKETDPYKIRKLTYQRIQAMRSRGKEKDVVESLSNLQELFFSKSFKKFIDVKEDFSYSDCHRGSNFHDSVPWNMTWPKTMKIVSRADLNLDKCAVEGKIVYNKNDFISEVGKILGR